MKELIEAYITAKTVLLLDTSFMATAWFPDLFSRLTHLCRKAADVRIVVPGRAYTIELPNLACSFKPDARHADAARILIQNAARTGDVYISPDATSLSSADNAILSLAITYLGHYNVLVLTNDNGLAKALCSIDLSCLKNPGSIRILRCTDGNLNLFYPRPLLPQEDPPAYFAALPLSTGRPADAHPLPAIIPKPGNCFTIGWGSPVYLAKGPSPSPLFHPVAGMPDCYAFFPPSRTTVTARKLDLLKRLTFALQDVPDDQMPLLLPSDKLSSSFDSYPAGYLISFPNANLYSPLKQCARKMFQYPMEKLYSFFINLTGAILLAHRLGLVTGGLDPNLILVRLDTMQVKLAGCEQFQIADMAATPSFSQFAASSRLMLLDPRADTRPLALLAAQILSRGTAFVPDSSLLEQSMVDTLTQIIQGHQSCSVRQLRKFFIHALNGRTRPAAPPIPSVPALQTPPTVYVCKDCGTNFTITPGEQRFYESKGFELPQRCPACRSARAGRRTSVPSPPRSCHTAGSPFDFAPL